MHLRGDAGRAVGRGEQGAGRGLDPRLLDQLATRRPPPGPRRAGRAVPLAAPPTGDRQGAGTDARPAPVPLRPPRAPPSAPGGSTTTRSKLLGGVVGVVEPVGSHRERRSRPGRRSSDAVTGHSSGASDRFGGARPGGLDGDMAGDVTVSGVSDSPHAQPDPGRGERPRRDARRGALRHRGRPAWHCSRDPRAAVRPRRSPSGVPSQEPGRSSTASPRSAAPRSTEDLELGAVARGRLPLADLAGRQRADRRVGPGATRPGERRGCAPRRPGGQGVYLWMFVRAGRSASGLGVLRPARPQGTAPVHGDRTRRVDRHQQLAGTRVGRPKGEDDGRTWTFPDTPRLSTYNPVVNAGPVPRDPRERDGYGLGLFCRQSLRAVQAGRPQALPADRAGARVLRRAVRVAFPQERYDQVFVPDLGGAMENWGCVTWSDTFLTRSRPTHGEREFRRHGAAPRDGAHVVRRPGDDALVGRPLAQRGVRFLGRHLGGHGTQPTTPTPTRRILATLELRGLPHRHGTGHATPFVPRSRTSSGAFANFDEITYEKGQAVLRQLVAYVGEDRFVEGLRAYFRDPSLGQHDPGRPDASPSARRRGATWPRGRPAGSTGPARTRSS